MTIPSPCLPPLIIIVIIHAVMHVIINVMNINCALAITIDDGRHGPRTCTTADVKKPYCTHRFAELVHLFYWCYDVLRRID